MKTRLDKKTIRQIRNQYASGKFLLADLAKRFNLSVSYISMIINGHVYPDKDYRPPVRVPVDGAWASKLHKQGVYSFHDISLMEQQVSNRSKPLSVEAIRIAVRKYEDAQQNKSRNDRPFTRSEPVGRVNENTARYS